MSAKMTSFWFRISETVLLALAFMLPLAFLLQTYDGTAIKTTLFEVGTLALAFAWLFKGLERGRWELPESARPLALPALALLAWTVLRFALAPYKLACLPGFLKQVLCLVIYLISLLEFGGAQSARRLTACVTTAAWLAGLYGLIQMLGLDPFIWKSAFGSSVFSTFGNPSSFGLFLAICFPLTLTQWLDPERDRFLRWTDAALVVLIVANAFWARSFTARSAVQLTCLVAAVGLPLFFPSRDSLKATAVSLAAVVFLGVVGYTAKGFPEFLANAFQSLDTARAMIAESPWIGRGPGSFAVNAARFHTGAGHGVGPIPREAFQTTVELGLVGAGLSLWLFASLATAAWRARRTFVKQGALGEACYTAGLFTTTLGLIVCTHLAPVPLPVVPGWLLWPLAGILGGLTLLAQRGRTISVLPIPMSETARQRLYGPALLAFAGLFFFPMQWFDSEIENNIAISRAFNHDWNGAIAHLDRVKPGAESYISAQYLRGTAYLSEDKPAEALNSYASLEDLSPDYAEVHYQKAVAYAKLEDWRNAVASHENEADLHPENVANYVGWAEAAKRLGDLSAAETAAKRALALEPNDPTHATALAEIYLKEKRVADARKLEKQAAQLKGELRKKPQG